MEVITVLLWLGVLAFIGLSSMETKLTLLTWSWIAMLVLTILSPWLPRCC